ncbi:hypothetical protein [Sphingobium sp. YG1]|uniref:Uncharacterized protein n=1 Tax=Sphingobium limneticum TaxID=1007511 RepID=A0A5J5HRK3_9SPHN|nr:hypothetical protein [Sphingobium sp. YG1]KAA9011653.1 hypothetical protein F4U94_20315 [Sphingobium limneticum]KAA9024734.1 hypothetical protein F4U95_21635 [Sphingobium limneticum]
MSAIGLTVDDIRSLMPTTAPLPGDLFDHVIGFLNRSGDQMEHVYVLEKRGALDNPKDKDARRLVYKTASAGATMLRDMIDRAWREAATTRPEVVDPLDPNNEDFDPETGSAPPPKAR